MAVRGLVVLVIDRPDVVRVLGPQVLGICVREADPAPLLGFVGDLQAFFAPEPLDALAVELETVLDGDRVGALVSVAGLVLGEATSQALSSSSSSRI